MANYEVTATRRRPQRFDDLVGQDFVASTLKNSIARGQIAHAYLFSGPRGCGKTSTARILAKVLNCEKGVEEAPCGECAACKEIARGSCMDVIEIDGASNTSVNDVRQIKDEVLFPPNSCKYKIYIIDEVHMLSTSAFNALLKTIEEPPPYVIFIFATTELHKVPATIKSRCQQFHFRLGSIEQVKNVLADAAAEIGIQADEEALYWIARESTGSFRDAYTLFDQVAAFSGDHITFEGIREKLGIVGVEKLNDICEACAAGDVQKSVLMLDEYIQSGVSIEQLIANTTDYLRSLLLIQSGVTKEALLGQKAERYSQKVLGAWDAIRLERALSMFLQLYRDIRYSLSPRTELELAFTKLCWLSSYVSAREVKLAIDSARSFLAGNAVAAGGQPVQMHQPARPNPNIPQLTLGNTGNESAHNTTVSNGMAGITASGNTTVNSASDTAVSADGARSAENAFGTGHSFTENAPIAKQFAAIRSIIQTQESQPDPFDGGDRESFAENSFPAAANPDLSPEELHERLVKELQFSQGLLAQSLRDTEAWFFEGDRLVVTAKHPFQKQQLENARSMLAEKVRQLLGRPVEISVTVHREEEKPAEKLDLPDSVENVCAMFRGTVVGIEENSTAEAEDKQQETEEENKTEDNAAASEDSAEESSEEYDGDEGDD